MKIFSTILFFTLVGSTFASDNQYCIKKMKCFERQETRLIMEGTVISGASANYGGLSYQKITVGYDLKVQYIAGGKFFQGEQFVTSLNQCEKLKDYFEFQYDYCISL